MSLRLRIVFTFALLMSVAFSGIIWLIIHDVRPRYLEAVEESTVDTAELMAAMLSEQMTEGYVSAESIGTAMAAMDTVAERTLTAQIYNIVKRDVSLQMYITDQHGILMYDSTKRAAPGADFSQWRDVFLTLRGQYGARSTRTVEDDPSSQVIFVAAPIVKNGKIVGVLSVGKPTNSISFLISIAQKRFLLSLILVGLAAVTLSVGLSLWITRPILRLTGYAKAIQMGKPRSLPALGSSEMGQLGAAMEEMQSKLEGKTYIEDYVRALTHELKSPLTGIKGASEILRDHVTDKSGGTDKEGEKFLTIIDTEVDRLHCLVARTLQLSRLENVRTINKAAFEAEKFLQTLTASFQTHCRGKKIRLETEVPKNFVMQGDEFLLRQAVENLIANALDFSPEDSVISISVAAVDQGIALIVRDRGCGMPSFALEKAFHKFFSLSRPDTGKKSTGLGLPFVAEVAALHGGSVRLVNAEPGLEVVMTLPQ